VIGAVMVEIPAKAMAPMQRAPSMHLSSLAHSAPEHDNLRMKPTSKYFDTIRVSSSRAGAAKKPVEKTCDWSGCQHPGTHKAPKARGGDGRYYLFCIDHVRQYNASYNYFDGMSDAQVAQFQKDAATGHRPTWKTGAEALDHGTNKGARSADPETLRDSRSQTAKEFFAYRAKRMAGAKAEPRRYVRPLERKSLETMNLPETATKNDIKARFKELVKLHHPDANGGDTRSEETLREIIQAYNILKSAGHV
jgi:curved DNA-binding protein CbpA